LHFFSSSFAGTILQIVPHVSPNKTKLKYFSNLDVMGRNIGNRLQDGSRRKEPVERKNKAHILYLYMSFVVY